MKANYIPKNYTEKSSKNDPLLSVATSGLARTLDAPGALYFPLWLEYFWRKTGETWL